MSHTTDFDFNVFSGSLKKASIINTNEETGAFDLKLDFDAFFVGNKVPPVTIDSFVFSTPSGSQRRASLKVVFSTQDQKHLELFFNVPCVTFRSTMSFFNLFLSGVYGVTEKCFDLQQSINHFNHLMDKLSTKVRLACFNKIVYKDIDLQHEIVQDALTNQSVACLFVVLKNLLTKDSAVDSIIQDYKEFKKNY